MKLTLQIDETLIEAARAAAQSQGRSLEQLVLAYIEALAATLPPDDLPDLQYFRRTSGTGNRQGWQFDRDELHERK